MQAGTKSALPAAGVIDIDIIVMAVMCAAAAAALWEDRIPLYQFSLQFTRVPAYPSPQRSSLY